MEVDFAVCQTREQSPLSEAPFREWVHPGGSTWAEFYIAGSQYIVRFPGLADFQISRDGHQVNCWPVPEISDDTVQHLFLNQVRPLALSRAGRLMFHASAIVLDGYCAAFMGESGRGKSTLAASFAASGFPFLTDDGLSVTQTPSGCSALPGHPSIRLWGSSLTAILDKGVTLAPPVQYTEKARMLAGGPLAFCDTPQPLRRVYFLGPGAATFPTFESITPAAALMELVRHSFLLDIIEKDALASHFEELGSLVRSPIFFRLDYPRKFEDLKALRLAIIEHASRSLG